MTVQCAFGVPRFDVNIGLVSQVLSWLTFALFSTSFFLFLIAIIIKTGLAIRIC